MSEYYNEIDTSADIEKAVGKKVVIIDNYDSFTYNLAHLVKELGAEVTVYRNDRFQLNQLETLTHCFSSDSIYTYFVPIVTNRIVNSVSLLRPK